MSIFWLLLRHKSLYHCTHLCYRPTIYTKRSIFTDCTAVRHSPNLLVITIQWIHDLILIQDIIRQWLIGLLPRIIANDAQESIIIILLNTTTTINKSTSHIAFYLQWKVLLFTSLLSLHEKLLQLPAFTSCCSIHSHVRIQHQLTLNLNV